MSGCTVVIAGGEHDRRNCPVWFSLPGGIGADGQTAVVLQDENGLHLPVQVRPGTPPTACVILDRLDRRRERRFRVITSPPEPAGGVELSNDPDTGVTVRIDGEPFTCYHYDRKWARPFLYPVIGPYGNEITRAYPVKDVPGETRDHPHHKSLWVAWGDVNGTDNWSESRQFARQLHRRFMDLESGPVYGSLRAENDWVDHDGIKTLEEERRLTFYRLPDSGRLIDLTVTFRATVGSVRFGDTKEGGIVSVRVASSMDAKADGTIVNSYGGTNEGETWGKRAAWCDYTGPVLGKTVGVAVFDTPTNLRYPTYWHVRNYGLMTANPFGLSHFHNDKSVDGSHTLEAGGELTFAYRVYLHAGDTAAAAVGSKYLDHIHPPSVTVV